MSSPVSMLERIADALDPTGDDPFRMRTARRVLEAMREPSDAMIERYDGPRGEAEYGLDKYHAEFVKVTWRAMIDAALAE